jgi:hypothetical protein
MITDMERVLQLLKALREDVTAIKTNVTAIQADVTAVKDAQQTQVKRLTALEAGQIALDLKVEAIHDYQKKAHNEIMEHLVETTEISDRDHKALVKRVERIEKHLDLPPVK